MFTEGTKRSNVVLPAEYKARIAEKARDEAGTEAQIIRRLLRIGFEYEDTHRLVRLPDDLMERVAAQAREGDRTTEQEIVRIVRRALEELYGRDDSSR